jgi:hypothetical protein
MHGAFLCRGGAATPNYKAANSASGRSVCRWKLVVVSHHSMIAKLGKSLVTLLGHFTSELVTRVALQMLEQQLRGAV